MPGDYTRREGVSDFRVLSEDTRTAYCLLDLEGRVVEANAGYIQLTGHQTLDDIRGRNPVEWTAPYDVERNARELKETPERGGVIALRVDYLHSEGRIVPIQILSALVETKSGTRILGLCSDLTAQIEAEKTLIESHNYLNAIIEGTPDIIFARDINGRHTIANSSFAKLLGIWREEIIGKTNMELFPPELARELDAEDKEVLDSGQICITENSLELAGSTRIFETTKYPFFDNEGKIKNIIGITHEVTRRKQIEQSLLEAQEQLERRVDERTIELTKTNAALLKNEHNLRQLVESTKAIPWEADAKTWQFTYIGPQAVKLTGFSVEQWYENDFWVNHIHPEDRDYAVKYCQDSSKHYDEYEFDYRMITANGNIVWLRDIVSVVRINGDAKKLRGFMIDITEDKAVEENLRAAEDEATLHRERLAHLIRVQTLGELATGIAHEINQPLAAIVSYSQASQRHLQSGTAKAEKIEELLDKITGQAERAGNIISRLRAMMQHHTINIIPVNINELLIEVSKIAEIDTRLHECNLELKLAPSVPNVICDDIQIQQVVLNLIRNGIDAMTTMDCCNEKLITVTTKHSNEKGVVISIADCGPGIAEQDIGNVFEAFYTTKKSGMGMGLAICRNIINSHGGEIDFTQNEAGGTTFNFILPVETQLV